MILLEVAVNLFTRTWFRIRSVTSARQACRKIAVLSLIRSQRQLACEGLYGKRDLSERWFVALQQQVIIWINTFSLSVRFCSINPQAVSQKRYLSLIWVWKLQILEYSQVSHGPMIYMALCWWSMFGCAKQIHHRPVCTLVLGKWLFVCHMCM